MYRHLGRLARAPVRFSSQQSASQAAAKASSLLTSASAYANVAVYWGKVSVELLKHIWLKEGLSPPTMQQFQKVFTEDLLAVFNCAKKQLAQPAAAIKQASSFSKQQYVNWGALGIQFLGIFSLGEIIGRRHVYGYKKH